MRRKISKFRIKMLILRERAKLLTYRMRLFLWSMAFILIGFVLYRIISGNIWIVEEVTENATMIGVLGTLLGAVIGGIFTLLGSISVSRYQIKIQTKIRRKNVIYKPIYDELIVIHNEILEENPYPIYVSFQKEIRSIQPYPQFSAWQRIKTDTRYLETPSNLRKILDELEERVHAYGRLRHKVSSVIQNTANDVLQEFVGEKNSLINLGDAISGSVLRGDKEELVKNDDILFGVDRSSKEMDDAIRIKIVDELLERCDKNEDVKAVKEAYAQWRQTEGQAIALLASMIRHISISCEG